MTRIRSMNSCSIPVINSKLITLHVYSSAAIFFFCLQTYCLFTSQIWGSVRWLVGQYGSGKACGSVFVGLLVQFGNLQMLCMWSSDSQVTTLHTSTLKQKHNTYKLNCKHEAMLTDLCGRCTNKYKCFICYLFFNVVFLK